MCRSTNHQSGVIEPEVWFRIVHITLDEHSAAVGVADQKQTVEIALGPKGAFENDNIGSLTRRVTANQVVGAVPPVRGRPKPPKKKRTPRVVKLLRKAIEWRALLTSGTADSQAEIARRESLTRARVTQVMNLLSLAREIQEHVLSLPDTAGRPAITERSLRPIAKLEERKAQLAAFSELLDTTTESPHTTR